MFLVTEQPLSVYISHWLDVFGAWEGAERPFSSSRWVIVTAEEIMGGGFVQSVGVLPAGWCVSGGFVQPVGDLGRWVVCEREIPPVSGGFGRGDGLGESVFIQSMEENGVVGVVKRVDLSSRWGNSDVE